MSEEAENVFLSVVLPEDLKRWVRVEAAQRDMSASAYVRDLVTRERALTPSPEGTHAHGIPRVDA
jgi:hypothetical protein